MECQTEERNCNHTDVTAWVIPNQSAGWLQYTGTSITAPPKAPSRSQLGLGSGSIQYGLQLQRQSHAATDLQLPHQEGLQLLFVCLSLTTLLLQIYLATYLPITPMLDHLSSSIPAVAPASP